nr:peptidylprolyl isomerase [Saprospiraceae bacterium]
MIRNVSILYAIGMVILFGACNAPKALFLIHQEEPEAPSKVEFINRSENAENYEWDFGDGTYSVESNPEHRYRRSGTYTVKLKALQGKRTRDLEKEIVVQPPSSTIVEVETDHGTMMIELFDETPLHRDNFIKLVSEGYYDSLLFHRVMQGF